MGHGYDGITVPYKGSAWESFIGDVRSEFNGNASSLQTVAAILRRELPHAKNVNTGRRGIGGYAEKVIAAIQIARHLNRSAAAQIAAAAALTKADDIYNGTFGTGRGQHREREGRFDAGR